MLLLGEVLDLGRLVGLVDATFSAVALDIGELVNAESVLLVEGGEVELASSGGSLGGRGVLDKGESLRDQFQALYYSFHAQHLPKRLSIVAHGHVYRVLACLADCVELLQQELDKLGLLVLSDLGKAIDNDKVVIALV